MFALHGFFLLEKRKDSLWKKLLLWESTGKFWLRRKKFKYLESDFLYFIPQSHIHISFCYNITSIIGKHHSPSSMSMLLLFAFAYAHYIYRQWVCLPVTDWSLSTIMRRNQIIHPHFATSHAQPRKHSFLGRGLAPYKKGDNMARLRINSHDPYCPFFAWLVAFANVPSENRTHNWDLGVLVRSVNSSQGMIF